MDAVTEEDRIATRIDETQTKYKPPQPPHVVTVNPATVRVLARPALRCDWPEGSELDY